MVKKKHSFSYATQNDPRYQIQVIKKKNIRLSQSQPKVYGGLTVKHSFVQIETNPWKPNPLQIYKIQIK